MLIEEITECTSFLYIEKTQINLFFNRKYYHSYQCVPPLSRERKKYYQYNFNVLFTFTNPNLGLKFMFQVPAEEAEFIFQMFDQNKDRKIDKVHELKL